MRAEKAIGGWDRSMRFVSTQFHSRMYVCVCVHVFACVYMATHVYVDGCVRDDLRVCLGT
jgi:hypothetical protein